LASESCEATRGSAKITGVVAVAQFIGRINKVAVAAKMGSFFVGLDSRLPHLFVVGFTDIISRASDLEN
jgi:hypothetical protein